MNRYAFTLGLFNLLVGLSLTTIPTLAQTTPSPLLQLTVKRSRIVVKKVATKPTKPEIKAIEQILKAEVLTLKQPNSAAKVDELFRLYDETLAINMPEITSAEFNQLQQQYPQSGIIRLWQLPHMMDRRQDQYEQQQAEYALIKQFQSQHPEHPVIIRQALRELFNLHTAAPQANWRSQRTQIRDQWLTQNPTNLSIYFAVLELETDPADFLAIYDRTIQAFPNEIKAYTDPIEIMISRNALTIDHQSAIQRLRQAKTRFQQNLEIEWIERRFESMVKRLK
jgi:hypothetical protein